MIFLRVLPLFSFYSSLYLISLGTTFTLLVSINIMLIKIYSSNLHVFPRYLDPPNPLCTFLSINTYSQTTLYPTVLFNTFHYIQTYLFHQWKHHLVYFRTPESCLIRSSAPLLTCNWSPKFCQMLLPCTVPDASDPGHSHHLLSALSDYSLFTFSITRIAFLKCRADQEISHFQHCLKHLIGFQLLCPVSGIWHCQSVWPCLLPCLSHSLRFSHTAMYIINTDISIILKSMFWMNPGESMLLKHLHLFTSSSLTQLEYDPGSFVCSFLRNWEMLLMCILIPHWTNVSYKIALLFYDSQCIHLCSSL